MLLWALPAGLIPLAVHLLNRLRYRSVQWSAMMFVVSASRSSIRRAKLKHYLLLLARTLAVIMLVLAMARPTVGGWMAGFIGGGPDTVIVVLDRSATMEDIDPRWRRSKRERGIDLLQAAAKMNAYSSSRFVLIENVFKTPRQLASLEGFDKMSLTSGTDTFADIPEMLTSAAEYMMKDRTGNTEIWIVSDLQKNSWRNDSPEWEKIRSRLVALPQDVHIRIIPLISAEIKNVLISFEGTHEMLSAEKPQLLVQFKLSRSQTAPSTFPIVKSINGVRSQSAITMDAMESSHEIAIDIPRNERKTGWGKIELPADDNPRDGYCYFAYGDRPTRKAAIVSARPSANPITSLALSPGPERFNTSVKLISPRQIAKTDWHELCLLIWQAPFPGPDTADRIESFARDGGAVLLLPPGESITGDTGSSEMFGVRWKSIETRSSAKPHRVSQWNQQEGPLSRTTEGNNLPVSDLVFRRRQNVARESQNWYSLATFADHKPFLLRRKIGRGNVYICTSLPDKNWSTLGSGTVYVPMLQRMLQQGQERLLTIKHEVCGKWRPESDLSGWVSVGADRPRDPAKDAGVYRKGKRLTVLNRSAMEDEPVFFDKDRLNKLFRGLRTSVEPDLSRRTAENLQSEIWQYFVLASLLCLAVESWLCASGRRKREKTR